MTLTEGETLKLALNALRSAAAELYRASSYCNTYEVLGNTNDAITAIQKAQKEPSQYTALEQALTRLQKRYGELEAKAAAQPAVPLTDDARGLLVVEHLGPNALLHKPMSIYDAFHMGIDAAEAHHGITKKGQP